MLRSYRTDEWTAWFEAAGAPCPVVRGAVFDSSLTLAEAAALYGDDFLAGFTLRDSANFDDWQFSQAEALRGALAEALEFSKAVGVDAQTLVIKGQVSAEGIAETATELKADLIVMGSHGRKGFQKMLMGSFAQDVLRNTELPVLIVKA